MYRSEIHSGTTNRPDTPSCTVLAICGDCVEGWLIRIDILVAGATSTNLSLTVTFFCDFRSHLSTSTYKKRETN